MRSLKLKAHAMGATEVLTRAQMKNVFGGNLPPETGLDTCDCNSKDDCSAAKQYCVNGCGGPVGGKWGVCRSEPA